MIAFGLLLLVVGYGVWKLDSLNPTTDRLRQNFFGQFYFAPRWWGMTGFLVMVLGAIITIGVLLMMAARYLP